MFVTLIISAIVVVAAFLLAPKPPEPKPASLDEIDVPTAEEGRAIPKIFGTYVVKSLNTTWYGDLGYKAVKSKGGK